MTPRKKISYRVFQISIHSRNIAKKPWKKFNWMYSKATELNCCSAFAKDDNENSTEYATVEIRVDFHW